MFSTLEKAHRALAQSSSPKLLFAGNPGALISPVFAESFGKGLENCRVVQLNSGIHYLQRIILMLSAPMSKNGSSNWELVPAQNKS